MAKGPWDLTARGDWQGLQQDSNTSATWLHAGSVWRSGGHRGPAARLCFLPAETHTTPSSLKLPGLTTNQIGMSVYFLASLTRPQGPEGVYLYPHFFLCHFPPSTPGQESRAWPSRGRGRSSAPRKAGSHSLSQSRVGRVQQKLLPAVGAHQPHRLLVQAHLPETTPPMHTGLAAAR